MLFCLLRLSLTLYSLYSRSSPNLPNFLSLSSYDNFENLAFEWPQRELRRAVVGQRSHEILVRVLTHYRKNPLARASPLENRGVLHAVI